MLVLGIDTATDRVSVAVGGEQAIHGEVHLGGGKRHAETLVPAIEWLLRTAGIDRHELTLIAADVGPGLFTGMRVGLATATTMAAALGIPTLPMTSLDLLALAAGHTGRHVAAVVDARKGQVFHALFAPTHAGMQRLTAPAVGDVDDVVTTVDRHADAAGATLCVGDGAQRYATELTAMAKHLVFGGPGLAYPSAAELVRFAARHAERAAPLTPLYLRAPDAQINWSTREAGR